MKLVNNHDAGPLLYYFLSRSPSWKLWPENIQVKLTEETHRQIAEKLLKKEELKRVLEVFTKEGIQTILMKGMPLSYLIYPQPHLRPFSDVDFFIQEKDFETVKKIMLSFGYKMPNAVTGKYIAQQRSFERIDSFEVEHVYDFHWKISNALIFSDALSFEEAWKESIFVSSLGVHAKTLSFSHALLLSCIHRVAHHSGEQRLTWLYDIHLLISRMMEKELNGFFELVAQKKVTAVCGEGILESKRLFGTELPDALSQKLPNRDEKDERSAIYLRTSHIRLRSLVSDWNALSSFRDKLVFLKELFFPKPQYMFKKYAVNAYSLLPFLYLVRAISGLFKLLFVRRNNK